jgi:hypothetical protein
VWRNVGGVRKGGLCGDGDAKGWSAMQRSFLLP